MLDQLIRVDHPRDVCEFRLVGDGQPKIGAPLVGGATVTAGSSSTTTDGSGQYTLSSLAAGPYTVTASAQGYTTGSASVTVNADSTTVQNFALAASAAANTALAVASASGTYGGTTTLSATLTSAGAGVSGKTISFTLNGNPSGTGSTNGSGVVTISGVSLSGIGAGSYPTGVGASFVGDASYGSSSGSNSLTIAKASQTITFGTLLNKTTSDPPFTVSATASSGLPVSFAASGQCTVSGNTVTITAEGSCTITASQAGNSNYNAAPSVPQTFTITSSGGGGGTSATFVRVDTTTQGNWRGTFGSNGYNIAAETPSYPSFVQVSSSPAPAETWVWDSAPSDSRALQRPSGVGRIASCWYTATSFVHDLNFIDGLSHQLALYVLDWDASSRIERIDVLDAATGAVLDTRTVSGFTGGQYIVWTVRGHVIVRVSWIGAVNAVGSGLFID